MGAEATWGLATRADAEELAPLLRPEDAAEVEAGGETALGALLSSLASSSMAVAFRFDGELAGMCGVAPLGGTLLTGPKVGAAWCLTSGAVARHKGLFLRASRQALAMLEQEAPILVAAVDARYSAALRWVRWLGFEVGPAQPMGERGFLFHLASRRSSWVS